MAAPVIRKWKPRELYLERMRLGWTQERLAETIGCRMNTISEWETGRHVPSRAFSQLLDMVFQKAKR